MDVDIMAGFYEPDAILVSPNGEPQRGLSAIRAELLKDYPSF
jgi:ketosteroid isomerase-like protein